MIGKDDMQYSLEADTFDGTLAAITSVISASVICGVYLLAVYPLILESGFILTPKVIYEHLLQYSDLFNSISIIIVATLFSTTAVIPGFIAFVIGLCEMRIKSLTNHGVIITLSGFFGFIIGTANFYTIFKICNPFR